MTQEQWEAIKHKDAGYDGQFYYGATSTNTVCRPSCGKRHCKPENIVIFDTLEEALGCGFKPCKRCRPDQKDWKGAKAELAEQIRGFIEQEYKEKFSLEHLAAELYQNKSYVLRTFKEVTGYTPLEYHNHVRCEKSRELLENLKLSISYISDEVGFATQAHFTRVFRQNYQCSPREYRKRFALRKKEEAEENALVG